MRVWRRGSNRLGSQRYRSAGRVHRLLGFGSEVLSEVQSKKDSNKRKPDLCRLILIMFEPVPVLWTLYSLIQIEELIPEPHRWSDDPKHKEHCLHGLQRVIRIERISQSKRTKKQRDKPKRRPKPRHKASRRLHVIPGLLGKVRGK